MKKLITLIATLALLICVGCSNNDAKLIEALQSSADYATISALVEKGANPSAKAKDGTSAVELAEAMVAQSRSKMMEIANSEDEDAGGMNKQMVKQYRDEMVHNQMIVDLLKSNM